MPLKKPRSDGEPLPRGVYEHPSGSGVYWIQYFNQHGKRCREKAGSLSRAKSLVSERRADTKRARLFPQPPPEAEPVTLFQMLRRYMEESRATKRTWKDDRRYAEHWDDALGDRPISEITAAHIKAERKKLLETTYTRGKIQKQHTPATVNRYIAFLKRVFNYAMEDGCVERNPVAWKGAILQENNLRIRWLSCEQEHTLHDHFPPDLWHYVLLALETGLRQGEQLALEWSHIDFANQLLTVPRSKTGEKRHVPLSDTALELLRDLPSRLKGRWVYPRDTDPTKHVAFSAVRGAFERALQAASIDNFHWHDLRHSYASRAVMAGVDLMTVANWLGHKSLAMMLRYAHLAPEHHKASMAKVAEKFRSATPLPPATSSLIQTS